VTASNHSYDVQIGNLAGRGFAGESGLWAGGGAAGGYLVTGNNGIRLADVDLQILFGATPVVRLNKTSGLRLAALEIAQGTVANFDTKRAVDWIHSDGSLLGRIWSYDITNTTSALALESMAHSGRESHLLLRAYKPSGKQAYMSLSAGAAELRLSDNGTPKMESVGPFWIDGVKIYMNGFNLMADRNGTTRILATF
jgi:hypothetical protein